MSETRVGAAVEWRSHYMLPLVASLGYATSVIHIYGLSPYFEPLQQAFGWSRSQVTVGITIATVINGVCAIPVGMLVDRFGPRLVGLIGVLLTTFAFGLMGRATGQDGQWYFLWGLMALATLPVQATIWTSAVASRFEFSRGLALAVALSGAGVAGFIFPILGTYLIESYGWRDAFAAEGAIWAAVTFPLLFLFFRGANDKQRKRRRIVPKPSVLTGLSTIEAMRSFVYIRLFGACLLFTFTIIALVLHFLPILTDQGVSRVAAASVASLIGLFSIVGRLATGYLLDHIRASTVGAIAFLLPIVSCLLIQFAGAHPVAQVTAAVFIGLALGSEIDVVVYLTTRHFGLKNFGAIYGGLLAALSFGTAFGPLAAASVYDHYGSYSPFLMATIVFMALSSLGLATLPKPAFAVVQLEVAEPEVTARAQ